MRKKIILPFAFYALTGLCLSLASCSKPAERKPSITIVNGDLITVPVGQRVHIQYRIENFEVIPYITVNMIQGAPGVIMDEAGWITGRYPCIANIRISSADVFDTAIVQVIDPKMDLGNWGFRASDRTYYVGDRIRLFAEIYNPEWRYLIEYMEPMLFCDPSIVSLESLTIVAKAPGEVIFAAKLLNLVSEIQAFTILPRPE